MKRLVCTMLVLLFLCGSAFAESFDFSAYGDDELVTLSAQVQQEIVDRGLEKTATFIQGYYYVGSDIPAGSYIFAPVSDSAAYHGLLIEALTNGEWVNQHTGGAFRAGDQMKIRLTSGERIHYDDSFSLTIYTAPTFID